MPSGALCFQSQFFKNILCNLLLKLAKLIKMSLELNELLESDDDDCDYVPSEKELKEAEKELSLIKSSTAEAEETSSVLNRVDTKENAEKIWKDFLNDPNISQKKETTSEPVTDKNELKSTDDASGPSNVTEADKALVDAKPTTSKPVEVENTNLKPLMKRKDLSSVFDNLKSKKNKQTILQKSLSDWNEFKKEEGIEEDLRTFNKGKGGYINRQSFLERTDIRSYEIERDLRLSKK